MKEHRFTVRLPGNRSYPVIVGRNLARPDIPANVVPVIAYDGKLQPPSFAHNSLKIALPSGEKSKSFGAYRSLIDFLISNDQGMPLMLIGYGGGAVGDMVGFAAGTYRRGIPFIQMPTTLLAMVDASVGGKTAINHPLAKNMIGVFYQPAAVYADLDTLKTLSARQLRSGMAEVIKHGLIADENLFRRVLAQPEQYAVPCGNALEDAVMRSVKIKADVVRRDELETRGIREVLNLGHTLAHAIEAVHGYKVYTHGEAVSVGIMAAAIMSRRITGFDVVKEIEACLAQLGLPTRLRGEKASELILASRKDKKRRTKKLRMTLLEGFEKPVVKDGIDERLLKETVISIGASR